MFRILAKSLREYKRFTITTIVLSVLEVVFEILIPFWMSYMIDYGIEKGDLGKVLQYGAILLTFAVMQLLAGVLSAYTASRSSAGFAANVRQDMYDNVQTFSFANIDKFSVASIVTRLTTDVTNIQFTFQMLTRMAIRAPAMFLFSTIAAFKVNSKFSMIFLVAIPFLAFGLFAISHRVHPVFKKVFHKYDDLNSVVQENIKGIRVVKSFNQEKREISKFGKISQSIYHYYSKGEKIIALNLPYMMFFSFACMIVISWFGAKAIVASGNNPAIGVTTGELAALLTYSFQIMSSLLILSFIFTMFTISYSSAERITEILSEETQIKNPDHAVKVVNNGDILFDEVNFAYGTGTDSKVLKNINLSIKSGEVVGILGGTGSAKSSLVHLIPRLYDVSSGRLLVGGRDVREYDLTALRGAVSMVLQKNELFSGTIKDNLRWGNEYATEEEIRHACKLACADEFIERLKDGYDTHIDQGGANVSGGQKQRLCIARALLKNPKILILDDSTSAVDTKTDALIQKSLANLLPQTTKIIISQRVSSIQNADKIVVMNDGQIVSIGTHDQLIKSCKIYQEIYKSQMGGVR